LADNKVEYSLFTIEHIRELTKAPERKYKQKAIKILEYLNNQKEKQLCNKKELISLFDESGVTINKVIDTLEDTLAISYQVFGTNYIYDITPVGVKMLEIMKEKEEMING